MARGGKSEQTLENVRRLSRERFSELGAVAVPGSAKHSVIDRARGLARRARRLANQVSGGKAPESAKPTPTTEEMLSFRFVAAVREGDSEALRDVTTESMRLTYRAPEGDLLASGDEARPALLEIGRLAFGHRNVTEWWAASPQVAQEWWTRAPGQPFQSVFFSGMRGNVTRINFAFALTPEAGRVASLVVISAGSPAGRPISDLPIEALSPAR